MSDAGVRFAAMRGRQGDRVVYILLPTNGQLIQRFTPETEPQDRRSQRALIPKHAEDIREYVVENRAEYVLGALTYAIDVEGSFEEFRTGSPFGELTLPGDAQIRSIDGQHRRVGIQQAIALVADIAEDSMPVVLYVEDDLAKRRQMFSDMNWTPRKVSASENIAFDSRDPFSRAVQRLVETNEFLRDRVESQLARVQRGSSRLYTLGAVYDACRRLMLGPSGRIKSYSANEEDILDRARRFFAVLTAARPELASVTSATDVDELRKKSILVSSTTLRVLAGAAYECIQHHRREGTTFAIEELRGSLAQVDFSPDAELWLSAGFVTPGKATPNARSQEVVQATKLLAAQLLGIR